MAARRLPRRKPTPGHKFDGYTYGVQARCQCGWRSAMWLGGRGSRRDAATEFRSHADKCDATANPSTRA